MRNIVIFFMLSFSILYSEEPKLVTAIPEVKITTVSNQYLSTQGFNSSKISWQTSRAINYFGTINDKCEKKSGTNTISAGSGNYETIYEAKQLKIGKNEIRFCIEVNSSVSEIKVDLYRNETQPATNVYPHPADWDGSQKLKIQCSGCAEIFYKTTGTEQKYSSPVTLPRNGGEITFYSVSNSGIRENKRTIKYEVPENKRPWANSRISLNPVYFITLGELKSVLPGGIGMFMQYDHGPDSFLNRTERNGLIPGARIEAGILLLSKADFRETIIPVNIGPVWYFSPFSRHKGSFFISPVIGIAIISASAPGFSASAVTSNMQINTGYQYVWQKLSFTISARYASFFDVDISLQGLGFSGGVSYQIF